METCGTLRIQSDFLAVQSEGKRKTGQEVTEHSLW